jgi:HEAT repeats/PBS lyase HEAT-like repeat
MDKAARVEFAKRGKRIRDAKKRGDVAYLASALTDPDHATSVARILGRIGAEEAIDPLIGALDSPNHNLRIAAIQALGRLDARSAAPRLCELAARDESGSVRAWASHLLVDWRDLEAFDLTVDLLRHPSIHVRGHAAISLAKLGDARALEPLRATRPTMFRSPLEWKLYGQSYRRAVAAAKRAAEGKSPRDWRRATWFGRAWNAAWLVGVALAFSLVLLYAGLWWALALSVLALLDTAVPTWLLLRRAPLE